MSNVKKRKRSQTPSKKKIRYHDENNSTAPAIEMIQNDVTDLVDSANVSVMFVWGNTANGELGLGGIEEQYILTPRELKYSNSKSIKTISCGISHTLVLLREGKIYSCGSNDFGQLGHEKSRTKLQLVEGLEAYEIKSVACGDSHSEALNQWGQIYSWGSNNCGQLGIDSGNELITRPKIIRSLATSVVVQIACGYKHCLALTNKGELYAWGSNEFGQLGLGSRDKFIKLPTLISSLNGLPVAFIACGGNHSFAISKSGAVYGWGKNRFGQLGLNSFMDHMFPNQLKTLRSIHVKYISCGEDFSVFLTQDGGVLTCGAGQYGQLGHGSIANEILPRKVVELMGSVVTQICCGRKHTLAYISSREKIYAFGLGGAGQLGTKQITNNSNPQVVLGPWVSNSNIHISRLFAGGDQCFVTVSSYVNGIDLRIYPSESQIWTVVPEIMKQCEYFPKDEAVDQDILLHLETVFSSQNCLNGSFLLPNDNHYSCTSKHHGVDMSIVEKCFGHISRSSADSIKNLIRDTVTVLLTTLCLSPPDIETLRIYLTLPVFHEFDNVKNSKSIQEPFAVALLNLKAEASKILGNWYYSMSKEYFERLIRIYKDVIIVQLRICFPNNTTEQNLDISKCDSVVSHSLELLLKFHHLNSLKSTTLKVPYETFYMSELIGFVDIRRDYVRWTLSGSEGKRYLCNYAFLFDAEAKTLILETDQMLQMHSAMNEATYHSIFQYFTTAAGHVNPPIIKIHVTRDHIVQDTINELSNYTEKDFKKPLKVTFLGEEAEDAGGVKKEFFMLLLKEVLDPKYGMFVSDPETHSIWFSEMTFEDEIMYYLVGLICGLAIYNFTIINLPFPLALYKKLLNEPTGLQDLKELSPSLAKGLQDLLDYTESDIEDIFCLKFEITRDLFGELKTVPLKTNGANIFVTQDNKNEYVNLYVDYLLNTSIERHFRAFHDAFHKVCGGRVLKLFHSHELMSVVIGNEYYDWIEFETGAEYKGGFTSSDITIRLFWEVFHELPLEEKKKFLMFLTGTDRIPIQGMKAVKIIIQAIEDDKYLPVAHTCFNLLDLPRYKTKEKLKYKLLQAIQQNTVFSLV